MPAMQQVLKAEEISRVAYLFSRGGRFAPYEKGWDGEKTGPQWKQPLQIWNAEVAQNRHAITGERFSGCPAYYPPRLSDGSDIDRVYPAESWPLKLMSFKSHVMSSSTTMIERLHHVKPSNLVAINPADGEKFGVQHGDLVRITTPGGSVEAQISLLTGVMPVWWRLNTVTDITKWVRVSTILTAKRWRWINASRPVLISTTSASLIRPVRWLTPGWTG